MEGTNEETTDRPTDGDVHRDLPPRVVEGFIHVIHSFARPPTDSTRGTGVVVNPRYVLCMVQRDNSLNR